MSKVSVKFGAEDTNLSSTLNKVQKELKQVETQSKETSSKFYASFKGMATAAAGVAVGIGAVKLAFNAVQNTFASFGEALDMGGRLNDLSARTGESAGKLLLLERAFSNAGSSAEKVGPVINKLQKFILDASVASSEQAATLGRLGLSYTKLIDLSPTEQLKLIAESISGVSNSTERGALAMKIFGKSGGEMLPFLRDFEGGLEDAKSELGSMVEIMDTKSKVFDTVSDKLVIIRGKLTEFAAGVLSSTIPALELLTTMIAKIDTAAIGKNLADAFIGGQSAMEGFSGALDAIKTGEFRLGFEIALNSINLQVAQSANSIYANFKAAFASAAEFLTVALGHGSGAWTVILSAVEQLSGKMSAMIGQGIYSMIKDLPFIGDKVKETLLENIAIAERGVVLSANKMKNSLAQIPGDFILATQEAKRKFQESLSTAVPIMDTTALEQSLQASKVKLAKAQLQASSEAAAKALENIKNQTDFSEYEIKIGEKRVTNAQRIVELENEIKDAKAQGNEQLEKELTAQKVYYEQLERSLKNNKSLQDSITDANKAYSAFVMNAQKVTKELNAQLTLSEQIAAKIREAEGKDKVDPGGKLEKKANEAIGQGDFRKAERLARRIERKEEDEEFNNLGSSPVIAKQGVVKRSLQDIAKDEGISTFRKSNKQIREELIEKNKKKNEEIKPDGKGKAEEQAKRQDGIMESIQKAVNAIQKAVEKIEPKLPQHALGL